MPWTCEPFRQERLERPKQWSGAGKHSCLPLLDGEAETRSCQPRTGMFGQTRALVLLPARSHSWRGRCHVRPTPCPAGGSCWVVLPPVQCPCHRYLVHPLCSSRAKVLHCCSLPQKAPEHLLPHFTLGLVCLCAFASVLMPGRKRPASAGAAPTGQLQMLALHRLILHEIPSVRSWGQVSAARASLFACCNVAQELQSKTHKPSSSDRIWHSWVNGLIVLLTHLHADIKSAKRCVNRSRQTSLPMCWGRAGTVAALFAAGASLGCQREVLGGQEVKPDLLSELCQGEEEGDRQGRVHSGPTWPYFICRASLELWWGILK